MEENKKKDANDLFVTLREIEEINKKLLEAEKEIYRNEGKYLEDTGFKSSVLKGWESFFGEIRSQPSQPELDRIFSRSSTSYSRIKALMENEESQCDNGVDKSTYSEKNHLESTPTVEKRPGVAVKKNRSVKRIRK